MKTSARTPILPCHAMFGLERGDQIVAQIETVSGQPCPCKSGRQCPLLGADDEEPPRLLRIVV